jgi:hypothetical protein
MSETCGGKQAKRCAGRRLGRVQVTIDPLACWPGVSGQETALQVTVRVDGREYGLTRFLEPDDTLSVLERTLRAAVDLVLAEVRKGPPERRPEMQPGPRPDFTPGG